MLRVFEGPQVDQKVDQEVDQKILIPFSGSAFSSFFVHSFDPTWSRAQLGLFSWLGFWAQLARKGLAIGWPSE